MGGFLMKKRLLKKILVPVLCAGLTVQPLAIPVMADSTVTNNSYAVGTSSAYEEAKKAYDEAVTAKTNADTAVTNAQAAVDAAQSAYTEAVTANSYTFFKWLGATTVAECMKTDRGAEYTHIGKEDDATSIANLKQALAYLEQCNQIRKGENLSDLRVATDMTAEAEACANWSSVDAQHHGTFENLAWGTDPYRLWYTEEKQNVAKGSGETGHYKNLVNSEVLVTGYGYNSGSTCSAQEFALGPLDDTYTVSEYEAKLDEYLAFVETGRSKSSCSARTWTDVFSDAMLREGAACPRLTAITAAMPDGTGTKPFGIRFPQRFFDVGIAEEHAVTFAAGQAVCGLIPVVAVYSSFLQRAYDQILEDVCMQDLHVVFAVDRAGIVGADGQTHQGLFDASFLSEMPNMTLIAPKNASELEDALHYAIYECSGPVAVRYGRGACPDINSGRDALPLSSKRSEILEEGTDATLFAVGTMVKIGKDAAHILRNEFHLSVRLVNVRFIKPLDTETLRVCAEDGPVITLEEGERIGGFGERAAAYLAEALPGSRIRILAVDDRYVPQGTPDELRKRLGLDADSIAESIASFVQECEQE